MIGYEEIASIAAAALTPYFVQGKEQFAAAVGQTVSQKVGGLVGAVLAQSPTQQIHPLLRQPNPQPGLQQMLLEEMKKEPAFAQEVQKHLQTIFGDQQGEQFLTQVFDGEVGKIINIMRADVVNIE